VIKYLDTLGFAGLFHCHVHQERADNERYQLVDAVFLMLVGLLGGARSISQCVVLWSDAVLWRVARWRWFPDESTVGRVFKELTERHISELESFVHAARKRVWVRTFRAGRSRIAIQCQKWVDVGSSVKTVYGWQQGTAKGYNPTNGAPLPPPAVGILHRYQGNSPGLVPPRQRLYQQRNRGVHESTAGPVAGLSPYCVS